MSTEHLVSGIEVLAHLVCIVGGYWEDRWGKWKWQTKTKNCHYQIILLDAKDLGCLQGLWQVKKSEKNITTSCAH